MDVRPHRVRSKAFLRGLVCLATAAGALTGAAMGVSFAQSKVESAKPEAKPDPTPDPADESLADAAARRPAETFAVLINGGSSASKNYLSHLHHLQDMLAALRRRGIPTERIAVFSADGEDLGKDLAVRGNDPENFWLIEGTTVGRALGQPDLTNTDWEGVELHSARLPELRHWFATAGRALRPQDTLLIFVTDHGNKNNDDPGNGLISLWNGSLSVLEFRALLGYLDPGVRVVNVMSQCYSGAFADAMTPLNSRLPGGNVCGFYSTTSDRPAYGCYPEGRDRDRIGHAFRFIDALGRHAAFDDVQNSVLLTDTTPDVPIKTSDLFIERTLTDEAARRKIALEDYVDQLLAAAWKTRERWEPQIRLLDRIGQVYGTFSPRTLAELKPQLESLQSLSKELDTYEARWKLSLDDLRKDNLDRFTEQSEWKDRLDLPTLDTLDAAAKKATLAELLTALKPFTTARADVWTRLQELSAMDEDAKSAQYRTDVRLAAVMRMRTILMDIAGTEMLNGADPPPPAQPIENLRRALAALEACESTRMGDFDASHETPVVAEPQESLPPFEEDLATVKRAMPSWLGVRFRPVPDKQRERFGVERGATLVEQVYADGPAGAAGIAVGDIIVGPPDKHFTEPNQLREWTMTSARGTPLALELMRDGKSVQTKVSLGPFPAQMPALPEPPKAGDAAPALGSLKMVRTGTEPGSQMLAGRHMLIFWATWCTPCKASIPELLAWSKQTGVPVIAVSDEDEEVITKFLATWKSPFPERVASDEMRRSHLDYGVSGTPTFVLVDDKGKIEWRQVGYSAKDKPLAIPGWSWSGGAQAPPRTGS